MSGERLAVDVGGTFTDIVLLREDGAIFTRKVLSSPPDFNRAIRDGVGALLDERALAADGIAEFSHAATVATNAIITRSGAATGLITTQGFRDVLEIRRMRMHRLYDINWEKPPPLVPRHLRLEVPGRLDPAGREVTPLDEAAVARAVARLKAEGVEAVAVCFLHAYANDAHERRAGEIIAELAPEWWVSISSEVLPEIKEYERTSSTVINAYVQPVVGRYAREMGEDMAALGIVAPIMVMQSNGGMMPLASARALPMHIIESGPAAGVTGAYHLARRLGLPNVMTLDMGGTTAKAALIEEGEICRSPEYEVGGEVSIGHRLMKGSGYLLRVPSIDLAEVGAGGGSIARIDSGGALKVGPESAGAAPGPACYDAGGMAPTITDANVVLGLTNPEALAGGSLRIRPGLAEAAIADHLAGPLGLELEAAAWAVRNVANSGLIRALRAVSTERGHDPRDFTLFAFGGMGPVHALDVADELAIERVIIPLVPGLFSALGLLFADVEHHLIRTHYADTIDIDLAAANAVIDKLAREAEAALASEGYCADQRELLVSLDARYKGQDSAIPIDRPSPTLDVAAIDALIRNFHGAHEQTYGYRSDEEVQIVAVRCIGRGLARRARVPERLIPEAVGEVRAAGPRRCYLGPGHGWVEAEVRDRAELGDETLTGPALIEEDDSLTVVTPGWRARLDPWSNILLERVAS